MGNLSDHDLLIRLDEKFDALATLITVNKVDSDKWRDAHEKSDTMKFKSIFDKLDSLKNYAASVAIVAGFCGGCIGFGLAIIKIMI